MYEKLVEEKIREAYRNGEFDNLPSQGKPINLDYWANLPEDSRAGYMLLLNGGYVPEEVYLLKEINKLRERLAACTSPDEKTAISKKLAETQLKYDLTMDLRKRKNKH